MENNEVTESNEVTHDLAENLVFHGNSVSHWRDKALVYSMALDEVWKELRAAGIVSDGEKSCAQGVRELAAARREGQ